MPRATCPSPNKAAEATYLTPCRSKTRRSTQLPIRTPCPPNLRRSPVTLRNNNLLSLEAPTSDPARLAALARRSSAVAVPSLVAKPSSPPQTRSLRSPETAQARNILLSACKTTRQPSVWILPPAANRPSPRDDRFRLGASAAVA